MGRLTTSIFFGLVILVQVEAQGPTGAARELNLELAIGNEDSVTISALNVDEISKQFRISSSGDLSLPMVGTIHAAGMRVDQLEREIAERLKKYVHEPQVTVFISERRSRPVTVSGAVSRPGVVQLNSRSSLFSVLVDAGAEGTASAVEVSRRIENGLIPSASAHLSEDRAYSIIEFPAPTVMAGSGEAAEFVLVTGDTIRVEAAKRAKTVLVTGEVLRPGAIELITQDSVSLTKALAISGMFTRTAKPGKTMIRHLNEKGIETALAFVDVTKILKGEVKDIQLSEGDIIVVPTNQWLTYINAISQGAIATGFSVIGRI
ncbi:MAG: polysaccharide biosynthesis/export family protein [Acidobacteriota bacterium]